MALKVTQLHYRTRPESIRIENKEKVLMNKCWWYRRGIMSFDLRKTSWISSGLTSMLYLFWAVYLFRIALKERLHRTCTVWEHEKCCNTVKWHRRDKQINSSQGLVQDCSPEDSWGCSFLLNIWVFLGGRGTAPFWIPNFWTYLLIFNFAHDFQVHFKMLFQPP